MKTNAKRKRAPNNAGTLIQNRNGFSAKIWLACEKCDGKGGSCLHCKGKGRRRRTVQIDATNERMAAVLLRRRIEQGASFDPKVSETFAQACKRIVEQQRDEDGVRTWKERLSRLARYCEKIADRPVDRINEGMLDDVLREAARTLSGQSVVHLRNDLKGVFGELWRTRCIKENPMDRVRLPRALPGKDERERLLLSDQEFSRFVSAETTPERLRVMALVMRNVGGMRTSDAHAWDWSLVDLRKFRTARVYRPKTERPKGEAPKVVTVLAELEIPKPIRAPLRAWWTSQGKPTKGPVFPIAIGQRAGERQGKRSHVRELRRALWRAGVHRPLDGFKEAFRAHKEAEARLSALRAGKARGDIRNAQRAALAALEAAQALDALQSDTEQSRATDVHSFRRAYATGLAAAGVEPRLAMALAGHRDRRTHDGYVQLAQRGTLSAPLAALPKLSTTRTVRSAKTLKVR